MGLPNRVYGPSFRQVVVYLQSAEWLPRYKSGTSKWLKICTLLLISMCKYYSTNMKRLLFFYIYLYKDILSIEINIRDHFLLRAKPMYVFSITPCHCVVLVLVIVSCASLPSWQSCTVQLSRLGGIYMKKVIEEKLFRMIFSIQKYGSMVCTFID